MYDLAARKLKRTLFALSNGHSRTGKKPEFRPHFHGCEKGWNTGMKASCISFSLFSFCLFLMRQSHGEVRTAVLQG